VTVAISLGAWPALATMACSEPANHGPSAAVALAQVENDSYTLMPLWIWIFCVVWWFIQDALKVRQS
jgi:H+-transporting ATPase